MEQIQPDKEPQASPDYIALKKKVLDGSITLESARDELLLADQASATHEAARNNLEFLEDEEIKQYVFLQSIGVQEGYFKFLGFTEWHVAQNDMFENKIEEGLDYFKKSLEHSLEGNAEEEWVWYGRGTIAYLEKDAKGVKVAIEHLPASNKNKPILEKMLKGLEERGEPDYKIDY